MLSTAGLAAFGRFMAAKRTSNMSYSKGFYVGNGLFVEKVCHGVNKRYSKFTKVAWYPKPFSENAPALSVRAGDARLTKNVDILFCLIRCE